MTVEKLTIPSEKWRCLSHYERRLLCSKQRRSIKRTKKAKEKDILEKEAEQRLQAFPGYCERLKNEKLQEEERTRKEEILRQHEHELWLKREAEAQKKFREQRTLEDKIKADREDRERRIKEEWEAMERKEREESEKKRKIKEAKEALLHDATADNMAVDEPWHNPLAPETDIKDYGTEKDIRNCSFYLKTGACRFGDRCSKFHPLCQESTTLLVPGMFASLGFMEMMLDERDSDVSLEYEEGELYERFKEFYNDVFPEFCKAGRITQFKVCCNHEPHLRGNVYVQYESEEGCFTALNMFNGRWYAQKQLSCELCHVTKWKSAICGLFGQNRCPKGRHCNFLHVFRNPGGAYARADLDMPQRQSRSPSRSRHWGPVRRNSYVGERGGSSRGERHHRRSYRSRSRSKERKSRNRSRSWSRRSRSRSRERRLRSRSRSRSTSRRPRERKRKAARSRSRSRDKRSTSREKRSRSPRSTIKRSKSKSRSRSRSNENKESQSPLRSGETHQSANGPVGLQAVNTPTNEGTVSINHLDDNTVTTESVSEVANGKAEPDASTACSAVNNSVVAGATNESSPDGSAGTLKKHKKHKKHKHKKHKTCNEV